jgi:hypothetical protein
MPTVRAQLDDETESDPSRRKAMSSTQSHSTHGVVTVVVDWVEVVTELDAVVVVLIAKIVAVVVVWDCVVVAVKSDLVVVVVGVSFAGVVAVVIAVVPSVVVPIVMQFERHSSEASATNAPTMRRTSVSRESHSGAAGAH